MFGRRQDKNRVRRRLFQRFQKSVERIVRNLVGFINDIDLVTGMRRRVDDVFTQLTDFIDPPVGGGVDLHDVHDLLPFRDAPAEIALVAGGRRGPLRAVQRLRQDARRGGFADAARA